MQSADGKFKASRWQHVALVGRVRIPASEGVRSGPRVQWFAAVLPRGTGVRSAWDADPDGVRSGWDVPSEAIEGRMRMK